MSRMEPTNNKTSYTVINIQERYERQRPCLTTDSDNDDSTSSEDSWKSAEYWNDSVIKETLRKVPWSEFAVSLMPTIQDDALQRALQECWTLDETNYNSCRFSLPMFATVYIIKYLHLRTGSNKQESFDFMDFILKEVDTWSSKLKLLARWPNMSLLIFSWLGHVDIAMALLDKGAPVTTTDNDGRTSAACAASVKIVEELRKRGANARKWDIEKKYTPLHCAAAVGCVVTVKYLIESGADVNAGLSSKSPLHYAVLNNAADCVKALLEAGASSTNPQVYTETPLHVAARLGNVRCTELLLKYGADVRLQLGAMRSTPLHLAARKGNAECIRLLLNACDVAVEAKNSRGQTAMHLATLAQSVETLDALIRARASTNAQDDCGHTPLHIAIEKKASSVLVKTLIQAGAYINLADKFGYTPLHIAALYENSQMVMMMLSSKRADVTARTKGGITALSFIVRRTPNILSRFLKCFDNAISLHDHELGDMNCQLKLDFMPLMMYGHGKADLMYCLVEAGLDHVLQHPMCQSFLHIKWLRIRKYFLLSLIFHSTFVAVFTGYVITTYIKNEKNENWLNNILLWSTSGFICVLASKELFQISHGIWNYARHWENWIEWSVILASSVIVILPGHIWQYHVAALGILLSWIELMMMIGRFPMFDIYIQMFTQVSISFFKLLAAYICLIIGFSLGFSVLHKNCKSFKDPLVSLFKTVIMMSGELEVEDIYFPENNKNCSEIDEKNVTEGDKKNITEGEFLLYPGTAHLMLLSFVILVTVILTNLMIGLAVSNIQELHRCANLDLLKRRAELTVYYESYTLAKKIIHSFLQMILCPRYLYIRPNDPREKHLPSELVKEIYRLVSKRRSRRATFKDTPPPPHTATSHTRFSGTYSNESNQQQQELNELVLNQLKSLTDKIESIARKVDTITHPC